VEGAPPLADCGGSGECTISFEAVISYATGAADGMHMRRVAIQLADLFARHGHAPEVDATVVGRTRTAYRFPLVVGAGADRVLLDGDLESAFVDDGSVLKLYLAATDVGAKALFLHSGTVPASAREYLGDRVQLWAADDAAAALGRTLWNSALGLPLPSLPVLSSSGPVALATPAKAPVLKEEPVAEVKSDVPWPVQQVSAVEAPVEAAPPTTAPSQPYIDLGGGPEPEAVDLETGDAVAVTTLPTHAADELATAEPLPVPEPATEPAPTTVAEALPEAFRRAKPAAADAPAPEAPAFELPPAFRSTPGSSMLPVPEGSNGLLPACVTLEEARRSVADRLFGIEEWELILQPVHLFDYAVDLLREGSLTMDTQRGRLQVNGTDRKVAAVDPATTDPALPSKVLATPGLTVMDKVLRVSPERAEQVARAWATELHGKTVHVPLSGADDSFDLTERRTVGPTSGQVHLHPLGVWHRPFWRLWGLNGHVDLDAVDGGVLDQELKTADPDVLVVE
jgi:hypothetical protein